MAALARALCVVFVTALMAVGHPSSAAAVCTGDAATNGCSPGTGNRLFNCAAEWALSPAAAHTGTALPKTRAICYEGDPSCDFDAEVGVCTFHVALCINNSDPRLTACTPTRVEYFEVKSPRFGTTDSADAQNRGALEGATRCAPGDLCMPLMSNGTIAMGGDTTTVWNATPNQCSEPLAIRVPLKQRLGGAFSKGRRTMVLLTKTEGGTDHDKLSFECLPSTCGDGVLDPQREQCDDGNRISGDGCDASCRIEIASPTASVTASATASRTATASATISPTPISTATRTSSPSVTATPQPSSTASSTPPATSTTSFTPTRTSSSTRTSTPTASASASRTITLTASVTATSTPTASSTATASSTPTASSSPTPSVTASPSQTPTPLPTDTPTPSPSATDTPLPTASPSSTSTPPPPSPTPTPSRSPTATASFTPVTPQPCNPTSETYSQPAFYRDLAYRWAPLIMQDTASKWYADFIGRMDFDGDWQSNNNWQNLPSTGIAPYIYYAVLETSTHWFIYYNTFHPRDWDDVFFGTCGPASDCHENDTENLFMMIQKDGSTYGRFRLMETEAHTSFYQYALANDGVSNGSGPDADDIDDDAERGFSLFTDSSVGITDPRPAIYIESKGHGICDWWDNNGPYCTHPDDMVGSSGNDGVMYYPNANMTPSVPPDPSGGQWYNFKYPYNLISIWDNVWVLRSCLGDGKTFDAPFTYPGVSGNGSPSIGGAMDGDDYSADAGTAWWAQNHGNLAPGDWGMDPARTVLRQLTFSEPVDTTYAYNPFFGIQ